MAGLGCGMAGLEVKGARGPRDARAGAADWLLLVARHARRTLLRTFTSAQDDLPLLSSPLLSSPLSVSLCAIKREFRESVQQRRQGGKECRMAHRQREERRGACGVVWCGVVGVNQNTNMNADDR